MSYKLLLCGFYIYINYSNGAACIGEFLNASVLLRRVSFRAYSTLESHLDLKNIVVGYGKTKFGPYLDVDQFSYAPPRRISFPVEGCSIFLKVLGEGMCRKEAPKNFSGTVVGLSEDTLMLYKENEWIKVPLSKYLGKMACHLTTPKKELESVPHRKMAVYLILKQEGKVLLLQRRNTGYEDGKYGLVAGHVDFPESVFEAMIREAYEESDISIQSRDLKLVKILHQDLYVNYFFSCSAWTGEIKNKEPHKCKELKFYHLTELPENTIPYIREIIMSIG